MSLTKLRFFRLVIITILLGVGLGIYSPISAQDETPTPPPTDAPTLEPTFTEVPTLEPTATEIPPTAEPTLEPTVEPSVEPTLEPSVEPTLVPTSEPTSDVITATPEGSEATETVEPTIEGTPEFITATPEGLLTEEVTEEAVRSAGRDGGLRVEADLLELQELLVAGDVARAQSEAAAMQLDVSDNGQLVHIEVLASDSAEADRLRPIIESMGGVFLIGFERRMEFDFPILRLMQLDTTPGSFAVIQPQEGRPALGPVTTEGVQVTGAAQWHARGIDGLGVKIGVVDLGFNAYASTETTNCVKAASNFVPNTTFMTFGDHGTNVAQIICDMAPKAEVYLAQATTLSSLNAAVDWLISQNVNVINMSMRWDALGAGDGTGEANTVIQRAIDAGILWVNAAGNSNGDTWNGAYVNTAVDPDGIPGGGEPPNLPSHNYMNFGGTIPTVMDLLGGLTEGQLGCTSGFALSLHAILRWSDWNATRTGNAANQDYDIYIMRTINDGVSWSFVTSSFDNQQDNDAITPIEEASAVFPCFDANARYGVIINRWSASGPDEHMQLITWVSGPLENPTSGSSISTPADSQAVLSVAAGEVKAAGFPFSPFGYPDLAVYSSRGPILGLGGIAPGACSPNCKPDVTAPTNVLTSRSTAFNGTSAASPHATGFAALVYQSRRATFEALSGSARSAAIKTQILSLFTRDAPPDSDYPFCEASPQFCFGQGILTIYPDWFSWTDAKLEHTSGTIIRSGSGWLQQTQAGSSGGNYAYTKGTFAQIEFGVANATGVNICLYQRPDLVGVTAQVFRDGIPVGTPFDLDNPTPAQTCQIVATTAYNDFNLFTIRPVGGNGLTFDYIQVQQAVPTLQENQLNLFGTWTRTALASTSGGFYSINSQRGAGVQFYTNDTQFVINYTKRPTGGIMEIWVNGQRLPEGLLSCPEILVPIHEINTYSGSTTLTSTQHICRVASLNTVFGAGPYMVELINSGRQTPSTTVRPIISIDNIRFPGGAGVIIAPVSLETEVGYTGQGFNAPAPLVPSTMLPMNGVWTNMVAASASGGRHFTTTTSGAELRFNMNIRRAVIYFTSSTTGALLDIYVNGEICAACGTIDTYRPAVMYKVPFMLNIPASIPGSLFHITLRNSGRANPTVTATTRTMTIDRVDLLSGLFQPLFLYNVQGNNGGHFTINERWIMNAQTQALGGDVYLNNSQYGSIFFNTSSQNFTLLLGKNPNGGVVRVKIWDGSAYDLLAEFNGQSTSTLWRYGLNVTVPGGYSAPYIILVEVDAQTQFGGGTLDYGYVDAVLTNDSATLLPIGFTTLAEMYRNGAAHSDLNLVEVGPGWENIPANTLVPDEFAAIQGESARRTRGSGASFQFTLPDATTYPRLLYNRMPDGGIGELWINGVFQYEIDFYSPVARAQQLLTLTLPPSGLQFPAVVEIRHTGRRTTGSTSTYIYVDAVLATSPGAGGFLTPPLVGTGIQNGDLRLQPFGATWTTSVPSTTIFPSGSSIATTTANSGGVRFILTDTTPAEVGFTFVTSMSANRGVAEMWVNGRLCSGCGTINTYRATTFWQVPYRVIIPASITSVYDTGPYYIEVRTTNVRSTGATGFGLSVDEIVPLSGGTIVADTDPLWDSMFSEFTPIVVGYDGLWTNVVNTFAFEGSYRRTTVAFDSYEFETNTNELVVLRYMSAMGGTAEIWVRDPTSNPLSFELCFECGTINSYSPYARFQAPFYFQIPDRFGTTGPWRVQIVNTGARPAGSSGTELALDGFIALPVVP